MHPEWANPERKEVGQGLTGPKGGQDGTWIGVSFWGDKTIWN
jgi:hypothetical protein